MKPFSLATRAALAALTLGFAATPLLADAKKGVDAWTRGEYEKAVKEWRDPALKGDPDAQFNMGQAYKLGRGVKQDLDVAADWYLRASRQGHLQSSDAYGQLMHYRGMVAEALPYLQASADRGEPGSQYYLATELFNGTNIQKDWVKAYAYMTRASSAGLAPASRGLAQMDQYIPLDQRQQGVALAGEIERKSGAARNAQIAGWDINTKPVKPIAKPVAVPPSRPVPQPAPQTAPRPARVEPGFPGNIPPMPGEKPVYRPAPAPAPIKVATAPAPVVTNGNWRIQLGAFGNNANAEKLWNSLEAKVGDLASLTPYLSEAVTDKGSTITRLQAGPFATRASAEAMCGKVKATGQACLVTTN
jgi:uncharacterized protein